MKIFFLQNLKMENKIKNLAIYNLPYKENCNKFNVTLKFTEFTLTARYPLSDFSSLQTSKEKLLLNRFSIC